MTGPRTDPERTARMLALTLTLAGVVTVVVGVVLGAVVTPLLYLIALSAIVDFALAYGYATGRIGTTGQRPGDTKPPAEQTMPGEDPSYNPYARED